MLDIDGNNGKTPVWEGDLQIRDASDLAGLDGALASTWSKYFFSLVDGTMYYKRHRPDASNRGAFRIAFILAPVCHSFGARPPCTRRAGH